MKVPVSQPLLDDAEAKNVNEALAEGAISGFFGRFITRFEEEFAAYSECRYGVGASNGTTALHLGLVALGIGPGDEVLVSTLTNMASFFSVIYQGAKAVPIDCEPGTWNMNPALLEAKITPRTKAIMVVHLFGHPVDMDPVMAVAKKHGLAVIEDCAEAHGATYQGRKVGSIGDVGCFSFYANKIITTGEGGMVTTNRKELADKMRGLRSLAFGDSNKFMHKDIGYNYRLTNVQAAIGCAQMGKIERVIEAKRRIAKRYAERFAGHPAIELPVERSYARNVYWMFHIGLRGAFADRRTWVMKRLAERGVESRECFIPYNMQEIFIARGWTAPNECTVANDIGLRGFYLPSGATLSDAEIDYVGTSLLDVLGSAGA
ncbi:MAG: DegT/DnrJ/EryC1/StrS aminotransferase family protein [Deltaproteobacteria bacterium]|nr:DegT/DnrJ/EryC1/StrS aminotransferase family protein [Deltaproteobacteria bacterium]